MTILDIPTVLIIEDETAVAELYATWLADDYDVRVATSGREGLESYDDQVDIVLLDRRMPDMTGAEVLNRLRSRAEHCRVAMVTAVEPSMQVLDLGFDDYVVKPVDRETLSETVESLAARSEYSDTLREYFALVSKKATLAGTEADSPPEQVDEYRRLKRRIDSLESELNHLFAELEAHDFGAAMRAETRSELRQTAA